MATNSRGSLSCQLRAGTVPERIKMFVLFFGFFLQLNKQQKEMENSHNKVYIRAPPPTPPEPSSSSTYGLNAQDVSTAKRILEELENDAQQM